MSAKRELVLNKTSWRFNRKSSIEQELERFLDSLEEYNEKEKDIITRLQSRLWKLQEVAATYLKKPEMKLEFQIVGFEFLASLIHSRNFVEYRLNKTFPYAGAMLNEYRRLFLVVYCVVWHRLLEEKVLLETLYGSLRYWERTQEKTLFSGIEKKTFMENIKDHFLNEKKYRCPKAVQPLEIEEKVWYFNERPVAESTSGCTLEIWEQEIEVFQNNLKSWNDSEKNKIRTLFMGLWEAQAIIAEYLLMPKRTAEFRIVAFEFLASLLLSNKLTSSEKKFYYTKKRYHTKNEFHTLGMYIHSHSTAPTKFRVLDSLVYGSLVYWGSEIDQDLFKNIDKRSMFGEVQRRLSINMMLDRPNVPKSLDLKFKTWVFRTEDNNHAEDLLDKNWGKEMSRLLGEMQSLRHIAKETVLMLCHGLWVGEKEAADIVGMPNQAFNFRVNGFEFLASLIFSSEFKTYINREESLVPRFQGNDPNMFWSLLCYIHEKAPKSTSFIQMVCEVIYGSLEYLGRKNEINSQKLKRAQFIPSLYQALASKYSVPVPQQVHPA
ncbi:hypothetical protein CROQUDRAFT_704395 [Cronartium quercuum f. sp. fusiforme G11]|uniref:Uncharacterized protein n=1 Tax=Cronartium quercuum f. sp. fusiforme G11 TaxID=708437 RepID=A0A9P6TB67_9BASI|nr:hypothetical protein CROQUDRAFT_704395 [Cronartium quercuum f. sp. fusiforme G11]